MVTPISAAARRPMPSLAGNVLWNWTALVFTVVVTFFLSPFVVRSLGSSKYGIWVLLGSLVGYLGLLDLGVRGAVTRYVAKLHAAGADEEASTLVSTALTIFAFMGLMAIVLSVLMATLLVQHFHLSAEDIPTARLVICLGGLTVAATLIGAAFGGVIVGLQRFDKGCQMEIGLGLLRAASVYLALTGGLELIALAGIQLATAFLRLIASAWIARVLYPALRLHLGAWDRKAFWEIVSFGSSSTLLMLAGSIILYSDAVVIGAFLPVAAVTPFSIAAALVDQARTSLRGLSMALTPHTSALEQEGSLAVTRVALQSLRMATLLVLPITLTFIIRGDHFIDLWMGPSYARESGQVLAILAYGLSFMAAGHVMNAALLGLGRHHGLIGFLLIEAAVSLTLSILLVRPIGLPGVAWATTLPDLVMALIVVPWYAYRHVGIPRTDFYRNAWLRPLAANVPFAVGTLLVARVWPGTGLITYFAGVLAVLPLSAAGAWILALDPEERAALLVAIRRRLC